MKREKIRALVLSALFLAIGYVLPFVTGQIPYIGKMLLPMHLPVFLCAMVCGPYCGLAVGLLLPISRSLFFGMPAIFPDAISMTFELACYGFLFGFLLRRSEKRGLFVLFRSLLLSMLAGRLVSMGVKALLLGFFGEGASLSAFLTAAFVTSLPGIVLQLVLIPALYLLLERGGFLFLADEGR